MMPMICFFLSVCGDFILLVVMKFWETLLIFNLMGKQDLSLLAVVFKGGCAGLLWNASDIMMLSTRHLCQLWLCRLYFMNTVCFVGLQCPCPEMDWYWCSGWSQVPFTLDHRVSKISDISCILTQLTTKVNWTTFTNLESVKFCMW